MAPKGSDALCAAKLREYNYTMRPFSINVYEFKSFL